METETVYLNSRDYEVFLAIVEEGLLSYKDVIKTFGFKTTTANSIIDRLRRFLGVVSIAEMIYKYYTNKLPKIVCYEGKDTRCLSEITHKHKPPVMASEDNLTPEQLRRMERMKKLGFTKTEILEEIASENI
jgi:hypothetical protein